MEYGCVVLYSNSSHLVPKIEYIFVFELTTINIPHSTDSKNIKEIFKPYILLFDTVISNKSCTKFEKVRVRVILSIHALYATNDIKYLMSYFVYKRCICMCRIP